VVLGKARWSRPSGLVVAGSRLGRVGSVSWGEGSSEIFLIFLGKGLDKSGRYGIM